MTYTTWMTIGCCLRLNDGLRLCYKGSGGVLSGLAHNKENETVMTIVDGKAIVRVDMGFRIGSTKLAECLEFLAMGARD